MILARDLQNYKKPKKTEIEILEKELKYQADEGSRIYNVIKLSEDVRSELMKCGYEVIDINLHNIYKYSIRW